MEESAKAGGLPPLTRFTLFSKLPRELRIKIWQFAAREPRIVEVCQLQRAQHISQGIGDDDDFELTYSKAFYSPGTIPAILHINRESRLIALEHYTLSFPHGAHPAKIYYNPSVDMLYFPGWSFEYPIAPFVDSAPPEVKDSIRRIAIDNLLWLSGWEDGTIENQTKINGFMNLEEFLLVTRELDDSGRNFRREFVDLYKGVPEFEGYPDGSLNSEVESGVRDCRADFERITILDPEWRIPKVRFVRLKRDGVLA